MLKECFEMFEHIERRNMLSMDELITPAKIIEVYCCLESSSAKFS